jgi:outer membrane protein assembly factor BamB
VQGSLVFATVTGQILRAFATADGATVWDTSSNQLLLLEGVVLVDDGSIFVKDYLDSTHRFTPSGQETGATTAETTMVAGGFAVVGDHAYVTGHSMPGFGAGGLPDLSGLWGRLCAFDFEGAKLWEAPRIEQGSGWLLQGPTIANGRVLVASTGSGAERRLYAFDTSSGTKIWTSAVLLGGDAEMFPSWPIVTESNVFIATNDGHLYAFALADGTLAWEAAIAATLPLAPALDPVVPSPVKITLPDLQPARMIDPLALILPGWLYAAIHKPYPPTAEALVDRLRDLAREMPNEERRAVLARATMVKGYSALIEAAFTDERRL